MNVIHPNQLQHTYPPSSVTVLSVELGSTGRFDTIVVPREKNGCMTSIQERRLYTCCYKIMKFIPTSYCHYHSYTKTISLKKKLNHPHPQLVTLLTSAYACVPPNHSAQVEFLLGLFAVLTVSYVGRRYYCTSPYRTGQYKTDGISRVCRHASSPTKRYGQYCIFVSRYNHLHAVFLFLDLVTSRSWFSVSQSAVGWVCVWGSGGYPWKRWIEVSNYFFVVHSN